MTESKTSLRQWLKQGLEYLRYTLAIDRRPRVAIGAQKGLESLDRLVQFLRRTSTSAGSPLDEIYPNDTDASLPPLPLPPMPQPSMMGSANQITQLPDYAVTGSNNQIPVSAYPGSLDNVLYSGLSFEDLDLDSWLASL